MSRPKRAARFPHRSRVHPRKISITWLYTRLLKNGWTSTQGRGQPTLIIESARPEAPVEPIVRRWLFPIRIDRFEPHGNRLGVHLIHPLYHSL